MTYSSSVVVLEKADYRIDDLGDFLAWIFGKEVEDLNYYGHLFRKFRDDDFLVANTRCRDKKEVQLRRRRFVEAANHMLCEEAWSDDKIIQNGPTEDNFVNFQKCLKILHRNMPVCLELDEYIAQQNNIDGLHIQNTQKALEISHVDDEVNQLTVRFNQSCEQVKDLLNRLQYLLYQKELQAA